MTDVDKKLRACQQQPCGVTQFTDCHMWKIFNILDSNFLSGEAIDQRIDKGFCGKTRHLPEKFASGLKKPFLPEINLQSFEGSLTGW